MLAYLNYEHFTRFSVVLHLCTQILHKVESLNCVIDHGFCSTERSMCNRIPLTFTVKYLDIVLHFSCKNVTVGNRASKKAGAIKKEHFHWSVC